MLFIPGEVFYRTALVHDADLLEFAFKRGVIIAMPTTLLAKLARSAIALLKAVALGWREARLAADAHKIKVEDESLYKALGTLAGYVTDLGKALGKSVSHCNKAIGNMESTLFLSAKRLRDLEVSSSLLDAPVPIDEALRECSRAELLDEPALDRPESL